MQARISAPNRLRLFGVAAAAVLGCAIFAAGASADIVPNLPAGVTVTEFTADATGVVLEIANGGSETICTVAIQMPPSETQAGNEFQTPTASQGTIIPPSPSTANAGFGMTGLNLPPGGKLHVAVGTKRPYTRDAGVMIAVILCSAQSTIYEGDVAGPTPPPLLRPCQCASIAASIPLGSAVLTDLNAKGREEMTKFSFRVKWTMHCAAGTGGCHGGISIRAPRREDDYITEWQTEPAGSTRFVAQINCDASPCDDVSGSTRLVLESVNGGLGHDVRARVKFIPIVLNLACGNSVKKVAYRLVFDARGRWQLKGPAG